MKKKETFLDWGSRSKRAIGGSHTAEYYAQFLDGRWRYVELALIADNIVVCNFSVYLFGKTLFFSVTRLLS